MLYITDQNGNPIRIKACTVQMGGNYNVESVDNGDGTQTLVITDNTGSGADPVIEPLSVTENGTYTVSTGVDGFSPVTVVVPQGIPIDVSTSAGMDAVLIAANVGKAYRFTGTSDINYTNGDIYVVEWSA